MTNKDDGRALWVLPLYNLGRNVKKAAHRFSVFFLWSYTTEAFLYFSQFCDLFELLRAEIA